VGGTAVTSTAAELNILDGVTASTAELNQLDTNTFTADITIPDKIIHAGDTNTAIRFPAADTVTVETSGVERLRVDSSGNVGIGTSSPNADLELGGSGEVIRLSGSSTNAYIRSTDGTTNQWYIGSGGVAGLQHYIYQAQPMTFHTDGTERMRITSTGLVGIGTSSPAYPLHVNGRISYSVAIGEGADTTLSSFGTTIVHGESSTWTAQRFYTGGSERMRIDSSGNLLVGRVSNDATVTGCTLGAAGGGVTGTVSGGTNEVFVFNNTATDGTAKVAFRSANVEKGSIAWTNASTAYNTSSDYRLKENVQPMQDALAKIAQLNPVTYTWKVDGSDGQGFIAHELQAVVPDCVTGEKDAVDAEGNPKYQGVDTSFLVATLVKAVQELKAEVDSLKAQLNP
jgi:hypothetical protein